MLCHWLRLSGDGLKCSHSEATACHTCVRVRVCVSVCVWVSVRHSLIGTGTRADDARKACENDRPSAEIPSQHIMVMMAAYPATTIATSGMPAS